MSDEKTLLPCPICGGQPDFQHFNITPKVKGRIICACGIELRQGENETEDDIRIIWNTRATLGRGTCHDTGEDDVRIDELNAENAKLRELVRDMWSAYHDGATNKEFRALPDRMHELGVDA